MSFTGPAGIDGSSVIHWTKIKLIPRLRSLAWLLATIQTLLFTFKKEIAAETKKVYVSSKSFFCFLEQIRLLYLTNSLPMIDTPPKLCKNNLFTNCCTCRRCLVSRWPELWRSLWIVLRKVGVFKDSQATKEYEISFALSGQGFCYEAKSR